MPPFRACAPTAVYGKLGIRFWQRAAAQTPAITNVLLVACGMEQSNA